MREQSGEAEESDEVLDPGSCAGFKRMNSSSSSMRAQIRDSRVIHITHRGALARTVDSAAQHDWGIECVPWTMGAVIDASSPAQPRPVCRRAHWAIISAARSRKRRPGGWGEREQAGRPNFRLTSTPRSPYQSLQPPHQPARDSRPRLMPSAGPSRAPNRERTWRASWAAWCRWSVRPELKER